jgi:hypothetical protein
MTVRSNCLLYATRCPHYVLDRHSAPHLRPNPLLPREHGRGNQAPCPGPILTRRQTAFKEQCADRSEALEVSRRRSASRATQHKPGPGFFPQQGNRFTRPLWYSNTMALIRALWSCSNDMTLSDPRRRRATLGLYLGKRFTQQRV